jgi:hypothetical protein
MACLRVSDREATEVAKELATSFAPKSCQFKLNHPTDTKRMDRLRVDVMVLRHDGKRKLDIPMFHASRNAKSVAMAKM